MTKSTRKGYSKKSETFFKKGNTCSKYDRSDADVPNSDDSVVQRPCHRYDSDYFDVFTKGSCGNTFSIPGADGRDGNAMVLRPKKVSLNEQPCAAGQERPSSGRYNILEGNILVEKCMLFRLINSSIQHHQELGLCENMDWDLVEFEPWGLFSSVILMCKSCDFRSSRSKLYQEVPSEKPGRKAAAGNIRLQLLLQDLPIGPTELQLIFAAVGLRAGSLSGMQKAAYKAAAVTEEVATADMIKWTEYTKRVLADRGCELFDQFSAQFDVRYHGMYKSCTSTPGPGAMQATATCVETITSQKKCIGIDHINKSCLKGARMKGRGVPVHCGHNNTAQHAHCSATQPRGQGIYERDMAERIATRLLSDSGVSITHLTTDSDATGKDGFAHVNQHSGKTLPTFVWYKDPSHVSRNMKKQILAHNFHKDTFGSSPGGKKWNYKERMECRKALAFDLPRRISLTLRNARQYWRGDLAKMKENARQLSLYILKCYGGDHTSCHGAPLGRLTGCTGPNQGRCWFSRSPSLKAQRVSHLTLNSIDYKFLLSVISLKISAEGIDFFFRGETSSRCESINRAISKSCPKNRLFSRTSRGRVCSAIGRQNNSFKDFTDMKFRAMNCALPHNSAGYSIIKKYQRKRDLTRLSQKSEVAVHRRHALAGEHMKEYFSERMKVTNTDEYHKYQLDAAKQANDTALDALLDVQPGPSTSLVTRLATAQSASVHLKDALDHSYHHTMDKINSLRRSRRLRRHSIKKRNVARTMARMRGSVSSVKIRAEHSYGSLQH